MSPRLFARPYSLADGGDPVVRFARPPLENAAALLRDVGRRLLLDLLHGRTCPGLAALLPPGAAAELAPRPRPAFRQGPPSYEATVDLAVDGRLSAEDWNNRIRAQIAERIGSATLHYVPEPLWPVVARLAWCSPLFRLEVGTEARGILQQQYIFPPDQQPVPIFAPETYWVLIATARRGSGNAAVGASSLQAPAADHLQRQAEKQLLNRRGWARFWDQYVAAETLHLWLEGVRHAGVPFRHSLAALPFLREKAGSSLSTLLKLDGQEPATAGQTVADPQWETDRPAWLGRQYDPFTPSGG